ncbi:MAG: SLC13 family permease [Planctomycetota bacterium]
MDAAQLWVLAVLVGTIVLLVWELVPAGITGLLTIAAILLGNAVLSEPILAGQEPFLGFIDRAVIAVASMFVISLGVQRTGAVGIITDVLFTGRGLSTQRHYWAVLLIVMVASAFLNNTPLVLIFMPLVLGMADPLKEAPSKLLIPLSFVSILGGMCTLIGTSTNLIVASSLASSSKGQVTLGMFDFLPMGAIFAVVGSVYLFSFGKRLLPERPSLGLGTGSGIAAEYMTEVEIQKGSKSIGKSIAEAFPRGEKKSLRVLQLIRNDVIHSALPDKVIEPGDVLLIKGDPASLVKFHRPGQTGIVSVQDVSGDESTDAGKTISVTLAEIVVTPGSRWVDRQVGEVRFRERYNVSVFAVQRHGTHLREKVEELRLKTGDILLVQGSLDNIRGLKASENFLVVEGVGRNIPHTQRAPVAIAALFVFMALAISLPGQVHIAALVAALLMVLGRCATAAEAYSSMDWDVLFLLGGTLALGRAFAQTGLAGLTAERLVDTCGPLGIAATVGGIYVFTALMTQVLSNNAAAAIMTPLAYQTGIEFPGADTPIPFVMAVAFGASCCFLTPIGYNTNLLVYGPGGYKFTDFLKIGAPLTLIFCVLAAIFLPWIYG